MIDELDLTVGPVAHGGHCVARIDRDTPGFADDAGRVVFVRHALPGERVRARITERGKIWRADAIAVLANPSGDRVPSAWPEAGPDGVGGGELAHVSPAGQRRWKQAVIQEQLQRLAGLEWVVPVVSTNSTTESPGYRTRISLLVNDDGRAGMRKHRSHDIVPLSNLPIATAALAEFAAKAGIWDRRWSPGARLDLVAPAVGEPVLLVDGEIAAGPEFVEEVISLASGQTFGYRVAAKGFWQVHRDAPAALVDAVLTAVGDVTDATVLDLYAGAGLFTVPLAAAVGPGGRVVAVEGAKSAVADARYNLRDYPWAQVFAADVAKFRAAAIRPDVVVLDPPRAGAGRAVVERIAALGPSRIVYVACDPAALARDIKTFATHGYALAGLRAFDLFPMTHHVECVAVLVPR